MSRQEKLNCLLLAIVWGGALALALLCGSCRTQYVPVETIRERVITDTVVRYSIHHRRDSSASEVSERVVIRDSVAPVLDSAGRVVAFARWHSAEILRDRSRFMRGETLSADSVARIALRSDSVAVQKPIAAASAEGMKRKPSWRFFAAMALVFIVAYILYRVLK